MYVVNGTFGFRVRLGMREQSTVLTMTCGWWGLYQTSFWKVRVKSDCLHQQRLELKKLFSIRLQPRK